MSFSKIHFVSQLAPVGAMPSLFLFKFFWVRGGARDLFRRSGRVAIAITALVLYPSLASAQASPSTVEGDRLALRDAEQLARRNNPQISVAKLLALAQGQLVRQVRAAELPTATANLTAVEPNQNGTRITAGLLNNPSVYERAAVGVTFSQLITDFGRSRNLVASSQLRQKAQLASEQATDADILLAVDEAFYRALQSEALLLVAQEAVNTRQTVTDQVQALTNAKLKSELDLSFANVNLAEAKLLLLDAENRKSEAFANLNTILGFEKQRSYLLVDESGGAVIAPPSNPDALVAAAFRQRPDLISVDDQAEAAEKFRRAEHALSRPTVQTLASLGDTPIRADALNPWYGAIGVNVSIPVFNGFLFSARAKEADYRASALKEQVRDLRNRIARDVQVTWLEATTAYQRLSVSDQLLKQANLALDLARTRYKLGLSSIVELSQAQFQQTQASISSANARYDYLSTLCQLRYQTGQ
jgi:outer membrane protein